MQNLKQRLKILNLHESKTGMSNQNLNFVGYNDKRKKREYKLPL